MVNETQVKKAVRQEYSARAKDAATNENPGACCEAQERYSPEQVAELPTTVLAASLGCGNPVALAELKRGEVVLDLGSGGGIDCFFASKGVGDEGRVLGVDMTLEMVQLATANKRKLRASNVEFLLSEMETIPLGDATVDVVISNCVLCLSPDKDSLFREIFRVLRPGGRFHVSDMTLEQDLPEALSSDPKMWSSCVAGADLKEVYLERMRRAGFAEVRISESTPRDDVHPEIVGLISAKIEARKL